MSDLEYSLEIQICPREGLASPYLMPGGVSVSIDPVIAQDLLDCTRWGDVQPACLYVLGHLSPRFVIVARDANRQYENREATDSELIETAKTIYFDSDSDFSDLAAAKSYLVWQAAHEFSDACVESSDA